MCKTEPKKLTSLQAQTAQVAELNQQVAELKARCSSMERELSHRSGLQGEVKENEQGALSQALPLSSRSPSGVETRPQPTPSPPTPPLSAQVRLKFLCSEKGQS